MKTTYLGLELKHPIVASASPLSRTLDGIRRLEDAGASAIVLFSLFEEQIRYEQESLDYLTEAGTETFAESLTYFPAVAGLPGRAGQLPGADPRRHEGGRHADHRQPQRRHQRRLDRVRPRDGRGRRQGDRAQHLLHPGRHHDDRPRGRAALHRRRQGGARRRSRRRSRSSSARSSARWARWRAGWSRPAPTAWCCSTASTSRTSTSTSSRSSPTWS